MGRPRKPTPEKNCEQCGARLERKQFPTGIEDLGRFRRRKYCNQTCMAEAMKRPDPKRQAYNLRARKHLMNRCENCGRTETLSIHHIDRNWRNNSPKNLMTLCASCHTRWHHERGHLVTKKEKPPCLVCGKPSYRRSLCSTHLTRLKRHGDPLIVKNRHG